MKDLTVEDAPLPELLQQMLAARQVSLADARGLARRATVAGDSFPDTEEGVLRWLAQEYNIPFTSLDDIEPDREVLSLFPARLLLRDELLPLRRVNGSVEIATSRLFATQGLDALRSLTGLRLRPVLAPSEAIQREMKKRLGVGADTIDTLDEEAPIQVVDQDREDGTDRTPGRAGAGAVETVSAGHRVAREDSQPPEHRGEAPAPRRAHQGAH